MLVNINKLFFEVNDNEFNVVRHEEFNNLSIIPEVGKIERLCSLLGELAMQKNMQNIVIYNPSHGGYVPINIANKYANIYLLNTSTTNNNNIEKNICSHNVKNIKWNIENIAGGCVIYANEDKYIDLGFVSTNRPIIVAPLSEKIVKTEIYKNVFNLSDTNLYVYIPVEHIAQFYATFSYYIQITNNVEVLYYDNLINLCIMVKNGGEQFEQMLKENMHLMDQWTILDTGSTDNTVDIIKKTLVGKKKGKLYEEPFINFRDSRNRLLELAGETCKYTVMLDDTYIIEGDLRKFLNEVRGDQFSDSFSLYVKSDDVEYGSNRVLKADRHLKYLFRIHEIIQDYNNLNVIIPIHWAFIHDGRFEYMEERTMRRKALDIKLLQEEIDENPANPRSYYYMAQTYNLLEKYDLAFKYFMIRANHTVEGFIQEKIDAIFEAARCANFKLNKPWSECEELYNRAYELDKTRPDSIYFLGVHHFLEGDKNKAYELFKLGFEIGYPIHCQYSLKPTLSYHFLPKFLTQLCFEFENYELGEKCARFFLEKNTPTDDQYAIIASWYAIFVKLNQMNAPLEISIEKSSAPILCFVADGGFEPWTGSDILTKGVGGSETYIIEMARYIQKRGYYKVVVFCNCLKQSIFEGVEYLPIAQFMPFAKAKHIHTCIISRFSEYIPVALIGLVDNIYLVLHDLTPSGCIIPISNKIKNIFCLSEWHVNYFTNIFPQFKDITVPFYYGIDVSTFDIDRYITLPTDTCGKSNIQLSMVESSPKVPYKFIYSSYPNRGLYELLQMWENIVERYPEASLHIYSDVNGRWVNDVEPVLMQKIRDLYDQYAKIPGRLNIHRYGWVNKETLAEAWRTSEYWLYPCTFMETFCLTAVEAALSKTLAITNGLAALENTVGNRGICITGDATSPEWRKSALIELFSIMENRERREELIQANYTWAKNMSWEKQAHKLLDEYIDKYKMVYKGMINWVYDVPVGTNAKMRFEKAIEYYLEKNTNEKQHWVLEIGVYAGTSLIEIIRRIPNSFGLGIDRWENYNEENNYTLLNIENNNIEETFYKNVEIAGLSDRIKAMKGKSSEILMELVREDMQYNFIYVDGSHRCLDVFLDLTLAWQLLSKGGVMAIDDYLFCHDKVEKHPYEYPFEAVNQFLKDHQGEYNVIDMDYRVFLEKI